MSSLMSVCYNEDSVFPELVREDEQYLIKMSLVDVDGNEIEVLFSESGLDIASSEIETAKEILKKVSS